MRGFRFWYGVPVLILVTGMGMAAPCQASPDDGNKVADHQLQDDQAIIDHFDAMGDEALRKAAETSAVAQWVLACRILGLDDEDGPKFDADNVQQALPYLQSASKTYGQAASLYGVLIQQQAAKETYPGQLRDLLQFAAKHGAPTGQLNLATYMLFSNDKNDAESGRRMIDELVQDPDKDVRNIAMKFFGLARVYGWGGAQDVPAGLSALRKYVEFDPDDGKILDILGRASMDGWDGEPDRAKARDYFQRSAAQGNGHAMWSLGMMYLNGDGVTKDEKQAWEWVKQASETGFTDGMISRAVMLALGQGVAKDPLAAYAWYEKAAETGSAHAIRSIGAMEFAGEGRPVNESLGLALLSLAAPHDKIAADILDRANYQAIDAPENAELKTKVTKARADWLTAHHLTADDIR